MAGYVTHFFKRTHTFIKKVMPPPDRWEQYCPLGNVIPGTSFIAFKVPLKETLLQNIEEKDRFTPKILVQTLESKGLKLGGIIDLTFTLKYYNKTDFENMSIKHEKVFTPGHEVPNHDVFHEFAKAVKTIEIDQKGLLIGVHCTHGVNRTGYLICRYMIEEMDMEPDTAITLFNEARGHNLERENYLEDLRKRKKGQSTYDPNYQPKKSAKPNYNGWSHGRGKDRWRNNRSDHPNWRQQQHEEPNEAQPLYGESKTNNYKESYNKFQSQGEHKGSFKRYHGKDSDQVGYQEGLHSRTHGGYDNSRGRECNWGFESTHRGNQYTAKIPRGSGYGARHNYREFDCATPSWGDEDNGYKSRYNDVPNCAYTKGKHQESESLDGKSSNVKNPLKRKSGEGTSVDSVTAESLNSCERKKVKKKKV